MSALTDRDTNLQPTSNPAMIEKQSAAGEENMPQNVQQQKTMAGQKVMEHDGKPGQNYISPSDNILSPASEKLANFKQRQMSKQGNRNPAARTLFARTPSSCSSGFDSVETSQEK